MKRVELCPSCYAACLEAVRDAMKAGEGVELVRVLDTRARRELDAHELDAHELDAHKPATPRASKP